MNKQRLLKLAEVLENFQQERKNLVVPLDRFDMGTWFRHRPTEPDESGCGTVACAVGFAMLHPYFQRLGLVPNGSARQQPRERTIFLTPRLKGRRRVDEPVQTFFGISDQAEDWLFMPSRYESDNPRPATVAKRIRTFVASGGKVPA